MESIRTLPLACALAMIAVLMIACAPPAADRRSDSAAGSSAAADGASDHRADAAAGDVPYKTGDVATQKTDTPAAAKDAPTDAPYDAAEDPADAAAAPLPSLPLFEPWPPPTPTSQDGIARALVVGNGASTWGTVSDHFDAALEAAGYEDRDYYAVPGGFALATRIERIDRDGRPLSVPTRWVGSRGEREWTLEAMLRELAGVPVGRYRTLVFVFSDTAFQSGDVAMSEAMAERWRSRGLNHLPAGLRTLAYGQDFNCDVLVYEFQQRAAGEPASFVQAGLPARRHLTASLILDKLGAAQ